ncbi:MAG: hypothetical protein C6Y22_08590 [Hapalosiphonaceae cyanobacterium JJU2]|nr:MAG: hypothetical protein C6Y22_08590 [Hapalosiphonaceae cyanobacterium JJU2]
MSQYKNINSGFNIDGEFYLLMTQNPDLLEKPGFLFFHLCGIEKSLFVTIFQIELRLEIQSSVRNWGYKN